jgi:hypothetical protein
VERGIQQGSLAIALAINTVEVGPSMGRLCRSDRLPSHQHVSPANDGDRVGHGLQQGHQLDRWTTRWIAITDRACCTQFAPARTARLGGARAAAKAQARARVLLLTVLANRNADY